MLAVRVENRFTRYVTTTTTRVEVTTAERCRVDVTDVRHNTVVVDVFVFVVVRRRSRIGRWTQQSSHRHAATASPTTAATTTTPAATTTTVTTLSEPPRATAPVPTPTATGFGHWGRRRRVRPHSTVTARLHIVSRPLSKV